MAVQNKFPFLLTLCTLSIIIVASAPPQSAPYEVCRHGEPAGNFGLGHGCELAITILCNIHCTDGLLKQQGYTSGVCRPFDPNCYCQC